MKGYVIFWAAAAVVFALVEAGTVQLVSIWFAAGSIFALLSALLGAPLGLQILVFLVASAVMLALLYKKLRKNTPFHPTNADRIIGQKRPVMQTIDPLAATGTVSADGKIWSAKSIDGSVIEKDTIVEICGIEGVKLVVKPAEGE